MTKYHDALQAKIEADLLDTIGIDPAFLVRVSNEEVVEVTMFLYNISYGGAKERITQAWATIHGRGGVGSSKGCRTGDVIDK